jgi:hypothetical protein
MTEVLPRVQIARSLQPHIAEFDFDQLKFAESLGIMGVPEPTIEDINVLFERDQPKKVEAGFVVNGDYNDTTNTIRMFPLGLASGQRSIPIDWARAPEFSHGLLSTQHNITLAHESQHVRDYTVERAKLRRVYESRELSGIPVAEAISAYGGLYLSNDLANTFVGSDRLATFLPLLGAFAAATAVNRVKNRIRQPIVNAGNQVINEFEQKARDFAESKEAVDLFAGVIKIELKKRRQQVRTAV